MVNQFNKLKFDIIFKIKTGDRGYSVARCVYAGVTAFSGRIGARVEMACL